MTILGVAFDFVTQNKLYLLAVCAVLYIVKLYSDSRRLSAFRGPFIARFTDLCKYQALGE